ncbi:hypothetical protein BBP40_000833 [Aspergillus hancockii]|nr:hypothetical protein BBP40_000833 [Aspergillus hancockii]
MLDVSTDGMNCPHQSSTRADSTVAGYTSDFFISLVPKFKELVYPLNPIITPEGIRAAIAAMQDNMEDVALVCAFAAMTISLTQISWRPHDDVAAQIDVLIQHSLKAHRRVDLALNSTDGMLGDLPVTINRIVTCVFLEMAMIALNRLDRSFAILREAITMIQMLKLHQFPPNDTTIGLPELARYRKLYWEVYIHERFSNVMSGHPCIMTPLKADYPLTNAGVPTHVEVGYNRLIQLFLIIDEPLLAHWRALQDPGLEAPKMTVEWIESKQAQLDEDEAGVVKAERMMRASGGSGLMELQHADLFITRLWLRTVIWQLALSHGLLRSTPPQNTHDGMSLHFPAQRLSDQLHSLVSRLESVASVGTHGSGILQKLFEITSTVADVLALPLTHDPSEQDILRVENFVFLVQFLFSFGRIQKQERDYLWEKLCVLQQLYPAVDFGDRG